jgi:hypothetical protein
MSRRQLNFIMALIVFVVLACIIVATAATIQSFDKSSSKPATIGDPAKQAPPATAVTLTPTPTTVPSVAPIVLQCKVAQVAGYTLPDPKCTPGAATPGVTKDDVCPVINQNKLGRSVSNGTKAFVRQEYNDQNAGEVDHLIPLELGGSNGDDNLWVEDGPVPNPKDGVERRAHTAVCHGTLTLQDAQSKISTNWIAFAKELGVVLPPK